MGKLPPDSPLSLPGRDIQPFDRAAHIENPSVIPPSAIDSFAILPMACSDFHPPPGLSTPTKGSGETYVPDSRNKSPGIGSDLLHSEAKTDGSVQAAALGAEAHATSSKSAARLGKSASDGGSFSAPTHGLGALANDDSSHPSPLGAWSTPLKISEIFSTSMDPTTGFRHTNVDGFSAIPTEDQWPTLSMGNQKHASRVSRQRSTIPVPRSAKIAAPPVPIQKDTTITNDQEYPWAAKMRSRCNLHRVTTPVYLADGTPKVCIPSSVLLEGLENQKEYVVGQFHRCSAPSGGQIHAVATRIWGRKCKIFTKKLGESSYLFHIPDESTRNWVIQRGLWHVDDCLMFVSAWSPSETLTLPEIATIPIWLTLKNIPYQLYSFKGIDWIASGIGEPMLTSKPWLDPTLMGEAKILVEVKLNKPFPHKVALEDTSGTITMVDVVYSWLPPKCAKCGQLGHKATRCLGLPPSPSSTQVTEVVTNSLVEVTTSIPAENVLPSPIVHVANPFTTAEDLPSTMTTIALPTPPSTIANEATLTDPSITSNSTEFVPSTNDTSTILATETLVVKPPEDHSISTTVFIVDSTDGKDPEYSSSEESIEDNKTLKETPHRKSTRETKPTMKAREMQRSINKGKKKRVKV